MYSRSLLFFLLAVPFAAAVPVAEQKHNGKPIQYVAILHPVPLFPTRPLRLVDLLDPPSLYIDQVDL